jgi:hypothetical protein
VPSVIVAWSLGRELDDAEIRRFTDDTSARYAPLYADALECLTMHTGRNGIACIGPSLAGDKRVVSTSRFTAVMQGSPSLTSDCAGLRAGKINASDLLRVTGWPDGLPQNTDIIAPPFSLVWMDLDTDRIGAAVDGLGLQQLFHFSDGANTVVSNKVWPILRLLSLRAEVDEEAWRHWFVRGWFHANKTGFARIQVMGPGAALISRSGSTEHTSIPVVMKWIGARDSMTDRQLLDRAVDSFSTLIRTYHEDSANPVSDLTGGLDTRAIASVLGASGAGCSFTTSGSALSHDVIIARKVARRLGLPWIHDTSFEEAGDLSSWDRVLESFRRMTVWSEGEVEPNRFEHFGSAPATMPPETHFYGAEAGVSKGTLYRARLINNWDALADTVTERFLGGIASAEAAMLLPHEGGTLAGAIRADLGGHREKGLRGYEVLDFEFLHTRIRRWISAHRGANRYDNRVAPFMHPDHIALAYALTPAAKAKSVYQHAIINRFAPQLNTLPVNNQLYLSKVWRWLPRVRRMRTVNARLASPPAMDRVRALGRPYLDRLLESDSPMFDFINRKNAREQCDKFLHGDEAPYYFVLRLINFDVWHSEFVVGKHAAP